jgi:hypothetical protein
MEEAIFEAADGVSTLLVLITYQMQSSAVHQPFRDLIYSLSEYAATKSSIVGNLD